MCLQNWKFVALPVPEIIGGTQKISTVPGYVNAPFSPKFLMGLCSDGPGECIGHVWSPFLYPIIAIEVLGGIANPINLGEEEAVGGRGRHRSKERWWVPIFSYIGNFPKSLRVSEILPVTYSSTALFPTQFLVSPISPKFPDALLRLGGWPLGYEERRYWANCPCN